MARSAFQPDAVLIDIGLPDISGTEVYARLTAKWPQLAVVFSTGHGDEARLPRHAQSNVGFLRKPYTSEALLLKLQCWRPRRSTGTLHGRSLPVGMVLAP